MGRALANHALGDEAEARRWLDVAVRNLDRSTPGVAQEAATIEMQDWMEALILRREAEAIIPAGPAIPDLPFAPWRPSPRRTPADAIPLALCMPAACRRPAILQAAAAAAGRAIRIDEGSGDGRRPDAHGDIVQAPALITRRLVLEAPRTPPPTLAEFAKVNEKRYVASPKSPVPKPGWPASKSPERGALLKPRPLGVDAE